MKYQRSRTSALVTLAFGVAFVSATMNSVAQNTLTIKLHVEDEYDVPLGNVPIVAKRGTNLVGNVKAGDGQGEYELEIPQGKPISIKFDMKDKERLTIYNVLGKEIAIQNAQQRIHVVLEDEKQHLTQSDVERRLYDYSRNLQFVRAEGLSPGELRSRNLTRFTNVARSEACRRNEQFRRRLSVLSSLYGLSYSNPQPTVSRDRKFVAVVSEKQTVDLFDIATTDNVFSWKAKSFWPQRLSNVNGKLWFGIDQYMNVAMFTPEIADPKLIQNGDTRSLWRAGSLLSDTDYICAAASGHIERFDFKEGQTIWQTEPPGIPLLHILVSPTDTFATINARGFVAMHEIEDGRVLWNSPTDTRLRVHGLAFSPGGRLAVAAGYLTDGQLLIYDAATGELLSSSKPEDPTIAISSMAFSPKGQILATGNIVGQTIDFWNLDGSSEPYRSIPQKHFNGGVIFDPSGNSLLITTTGGRIKRIHLNER